MNCDPNIIAELRDLKADFQRLLNTLDSKFTSRIVEDSYLKIGPNIKQIGVKERLERLLELLEPLKDGDVVMEWRSEVYEHDIELIQNLKRGDTLIATVPPLNEGSFDDADFEEFTKAQVDAAVRGVLIKKAYLFPTREKMEKSLSTESALKLHVKRFSAMSRNIHLYAAITNRYRDDFVIFGALRCSVSRDSINTREYHKLRVRYTSKADSFEDCLRKWNRLNKQPIKDLLAQRQFPGGMVHDDVS